MVNFDRMIKIEVEILFLISISQFVCKWLKKQKIEPVLWIKYTKPFFLKVLAARLNNKGLIFSSFNILGIHMHVKFGKKFYWEKYTLQELLKKCQF